MSNYDEIRRVRHAMSAEVGHDPRALIESINRAGSERLRHGGLSAPLRRDPAPHEPGQPVADPSAAA